MSDSGLTTGLRGLDHVLRTILPGDNIVWQVGEVRDYEPFIEPCCRANVEAGRKVVYFRFAHHPPLLGPESGAEVVTLRPQDGFEQFISSIHRTVDRFRAQGVYIFDCMSDLVADWYSDRMLGNFFRLICPYVLDVEGLAFFCMLRNYHSAPCCAIIGETTQILIEVFRNNERLYIHPLKVQQRHSPTMYMLHSVVDGRFRPVVNSSHITNILASDAADAGRGGHNRPGVWDRTFIRAEQLRDAWRAGQVPDTEMGALLDRLLSMIFSRDERIWALARKYVTLDDVLAIWRRAIGTGLIGGKAAGMLLARAILRQAGGPWPAALEEHDSFYVGSDVFYTYLVQNGCWWLRQKQRDEKNFLEGSEEARRRIQTGTFPPEIYRHFADMLDYFGQAPILVRSSSLLEDAFGNSFSGKYESVFCVNQGSRDKRLEDFLSAVRTVYASAMSEKALRYRAQRGMLDCDEQMSLLIQRVSGSLYGQLYYPQVAGVAQSYNPYVWNEQIDPTAGMVRMVFGLGTRAVNRRDDDYTRVVALNVPDKRPEAGIDQVRRYAQRKVDVLDLAANQLLSRDFVDVITERPDLPLDLFADRDQETERLFADRPDRELLSRTLTFDRLMEESPFVEHMRSMMTNLQAAYGAPVDTEFTFNHFEDEGWKINLVQCRPLHVSESGVAAELPSVLRDEDVILEAQGAVVGPSRSAIVEHIIYVPAATYSKLPMNERYAAARLIGRLMHLPQHRPEHVMLLGPGRWGTTTPSLGVPVSFAEISRVGFLCEFVAMHEGLVPDVSLGTHFFNELVEADILYLALFPGREGNRLNEALLERLPNRLADLLPEAAGRSAVVRVISAADLPGGASIHVNANNRSQKVVCYIARPTKAG